MKIKTRKRLILLLKIIALPVTLPVIVIAFFTHWVGLAFGVSLIAAGIMGLGFGQSWAMAYWPIAWKIYASLGVFTFVFLITWDYQNCCVGLQRFRDHLKHAGWKSYIENLLAALIWPWIWLNIDRCLKSLGLSGFMGAVFNALAYWTVDRWRGIVVECINCQSGKKTVFRSKTPIQDFSKRLEGYPD